MHSVLKVNTAATGVYGFVYTEPVVSPAPGTTVEFRVYIPTGAPVTAIQPHLFDAGWRWVDSWNPGSTEGCVGYTFP